MRVTGNAAGDLRAQHDRARADRIAGIADRIAAALRGRGLELAHRVEGALELHDGGALADAGHDAADRELGSANERRGIADGALDVAVRDTGAMIVAAAHRRDLHALVEDRVPERDGAGREEERAFLQSAGADLDAA